MQAVKNGDFAADVLQFPDAMGIIGVDLMVRHLNGEDVPERVDSGSGLATAENVDQYLGVARRSRARRYSRSARHVGEILRRCPRGGRSCYATKDLSSRLNVRWE